MFENIKGFFKEQKRVEKIYKEIMSMEVLIIEDNKETQEAMLFLLEELFKNITIVSNGKEGLELCKKKEFDLIITDLYMPIMDGEEFVNSLNKINRPHLLFLTSDYSNFNENLNPLIDGYIQKPLDIDKVLLGIRENYAQYYDRKYETQRDDLKNRMDFIISQNYK